MSGSLTAFEARCLAGLVDRGADSETLVTPPDTEGAVDDAEAWLSMLIGAACEAAGQIRSLRFADLRQEVSFKENGSPVTGLEQRIELGLRQRIQAFDPTAHVLGEEHGGQISDSGVSVAIDPVDGTWSLLNRSASFSISIVVIRDGRPWLALVLQPATGEVTYTPAEGRARILHLPVFGEAAGGFDLPLEPVRSGGVLVDLHPSRGHGDLVAALHGAWQDGRIHMLRASGGSPALALAEAARGPFVYVNGWSGRAATPYDLAAGALLVHRAGGWVLDPWGREVDPLDHSGPFIAGVDREALGIACEVITAASTKKSKSPSSS